MLTIDSSAAVIGLTSVVKFDIFLIGYYKRDEVEKFIPSVPDASISAS